MKTGGTQVAVPKASNKNSYKEGDKLLCIKSHSNAYKEGKTYTVYVNESGWKCLRGDDGLEDVISMMVSQFKVVRFNDCKDDWESYDK